MCTISIKICLVINIWCKMLIRIFIYAISPIGLPAICGDILRYIAYVILLRCEIFAILILHSYPNIA